MKCIVVSDNHQNRQVLESLFHHYKNQDVVFFHCGDSEFLHHDTIWGDTLRVVGNCDYDSAYQQDEWFTHGHYTILMVHGHQHRVNTSRDWLVSYAQQTRANIVFYGHTHIAEATPYGSVLCINPGSIAYPRDRYFMTPTYVVVELLDQHVEVNYYTPEHQEITELAKTFRLNEKGGAWS